jgi:hypothetical protein
VHFWDALGTQSTYQFMVDQFYNGQIPDHFRYGGGVHFSFPVEQYISLGYIGVVGLGLFYGIMIGVPFELQTRQPKNPFLLLLAVTTIGVLAKGLAGGVLVRAMGNFFLFKLLPIGLLSSLSVAGPVGRHWKIRLIAALYGVVMCYLLRTLTGLDFFDYLMACFMGFSYICSFFVVSNATEANHSITGFRKSRNAISI